MIKSLLFAIDNSIAFQALKQRENDGAVCV